MPFDIGFIELCVILVVGLIVLGPDKLPTAARALTRIYRTISRSATSFKNEVNRELQMDELKRQMQEQQERINSVVHKTKQFDINDSAARGVAAQADATLDDVKSANKQG